MKIKNLTSSNQALGLYLHFPFCSKRCPYCDFTLTTAPIPHEEYLEAVIVELESRIAQLTDQGWRTQPLRSLYLGGGTPGLWAPDQLARFIEHVSELLGFESGAEVTIEANPGEVTRALLNSWVSSGVNRLSLGAQSLRGDALRRLGRDHTPDDVARTVEQARRAGVDQVSIDLIHGLVGEGVDEALMDLERALALEPDHISLYQLTIEERTEFGARARRGERLLEPDERLIEIYQALETRLREAGLSLYEVSNAARSGSESRHNLLYWTMGQYLGIGVGAHGRVNLPDSDQGARSLRWSNARRVAPYLEGAQALQALTQQPLGTTSLSGSLASGSLDSPSRAERSSAEEAQVAWEKVEEEREILEAEALAEERVLVGLRLARGVEVTPDLEARFGEHASQLISSGLLEPVLVPTLEPTAEPIFSSSSSALLYWRATSRGRALLDYVTRRLILG